MSKEVTLFKEVTLETLATELSLVNTRLLLLMEQQSILSDTLDELVSKVDEINLPSGEGFTVGYES